MKQRINILSVLFMAVTVLGALETETNFTLTEVVKVNSTLSVTSSFNGVPVIFNINVDPTPLSRNIDQVLIQVFGSESHVITDNEISQFQLTDATLKRCVDNYWGRAPNDVFLRSPTPWGDLYTTYNWQQVTTSTSSQRVINVRENVETVRGQRLTCNNTSSAPLTCTMTFSLERKHTVTSSWNFEVNVNVHAQVRFVIKLLKGLFQWTVDATYGRQVTEEITTNSGESYTVQVTAQPNQNIEAILLLQQGKLEFDVEYYSQLTGRIANNYNPRYNGHHFYGLSINNVLRHPLNSMRDSGVITQHVVLDHFSSGQIFAYDVKDKVSTHIYDLENLYAD